MAFATLAINSATSKNSWLYKEPYYAATSDSWYCKMSHIGQFKLHMFGKKCLKVRLEGKKMSQYSHCAMSNISQQVSRCLSANQSTRPFQKVYVDWLNLKDGGDSYQSDGAIVRQVMMAVCKVTGIPITYFK